MVDPDPTILPDPLQAPGSPREAILIGLLFLGLVAGGCWWAFSPSDKVEHRRGIRPDQLPSGSARYLGDAVCSRCHPGEAATHARSGHARTLVKAARSPIARGLDGQRFDDPEVPGVSWAFALRDGKLEVDRSENGRAVRSEVEYAFGSGHHAMTFVNLVDRTSTRPTALEHRLTYFAHSKTLGLTPGQSLSGHASGNSPSGRVHSSLDTLKCFDCHSTSSSTPGRDRLDLASMTPNISCERCHGPGDSHVESARLGRSGAALKMPQGLGSWTALEQMEQCGECHRTPSMVQPGSIRVENPVMVRHQPVGLMQSACYLRSEGALSCVTCHDPHARTSTDARAYEAACLSCHKPTVRRGCPDSPSTGCLDCHMPRRDVGRGMKMTDHWIRRRAESGAP